MVFYPLLLDQSAHRRRLTDAAEGDGKSAAKQAKGILPLHGSSNQFDFSSTVRLPLVIRERDVVYQLHRLGEGRCALGGGDTPCLGRCIVMKVEQYHRKKPKC